MFEHLGTFGKVIVTGPQRSGTTVAAVMVAADLGYYFYPEEQIRVWELRRVKRLLGRTTDFVLQAPAICRYVHRYSAPDVAVVLVRRDVGDIAASERRVEWMGQKRELRQYGVKEGIIAQVKYDFWDNGQRARIENAFEVEYESLAAHPLWVPKEERAGFGPRQYGQGKWAYRRQHKKT